MQILYPCVRLRVLSLFLIPNLLTAILYYDYLLTFPLEVGRFWLFHETNWATALFYLNRYLSLVGHIPIAMEYFWTDTFDVKAKVRLNSVLSFLPKADANCF